MVIHTEFDLLFVNCAGEAAAQRRICALPAYCLCENVKRVDTVRAAVGRAGSFTDDPEEQRSFLFLPFEPSESGLTTERTVTFMCPCVDCNCHKDTPILSVTTGQIRVTSFPQRLEL